MVGLGRSKVDLQSTMTEEDIERIIEDLRYVLKNAAASDEADRQVILDLTKTIEGLTERRVGKIRQWDPAYGEVDTTSLSVRKEALLRHLEEAESKLPKKPEVKKKKKRRIEKEQKSLRGMLHLFMRRLRGESPKR